MQRKCGTAKCGDKGRDSMSDPADNKGILTRPEGEPAAGTEQEESLRAAEDSNAAQPANPDAVRLSVRQLAEYAHRSGSIISGFSVGAMAQLNEGARIHRMVQETYAESDQKEVHLTAFFCRGDITYSLEGRCDGLLTTPDGMMIDEIKSTVGDLAAIEENTYPVHWAQAACYAYMYAIRQNLPGIKLRLTYVQAHTGEQKHFMRQMDIAALTALVDGLFATYEPFARMQLQYEKERDASIGELLFPYPGYRPGQRKLAGAVYKAITDGRKLFVRAPTGIGKTISTLFPSVKAIGAGLSSRLFYLTARTTTRTAAEEAFGLMEKRGLRFRTVTITAKEKICFKDEVVCSPDKCEYAEGHFDRINEAMLELLSTDNRITREEVERCARKHRVCPFELSLDAAYAADAVICDYNYVFDPRISLKRQLEEQKRKTVLLVDEAHNLVDRARSMYSAELDKRAFLQLKRAYKKRNPGLSAAASAVNGDFIARRKALEAGKAAADGFDEGQAGLRSVRKELPEELVELSAAFLLEAEKELAGQAGAPSSSEEAEERNLLLDTFFAAQNFVRTAEWFDERYVAHLEISSGAAVHKLSCLDPSFLLRQMGKGYRSHVFFSATLSPLGYYTDMLGGEREDYSIAVPSPFHREQLEVIVKPLSTRYRDREAAVEPLAELIHRLAEERPGNYLVFFPSYAFMTGVYEVFAQRETPGRVLVQQVNMSEEEREEFLGAFQDHGKETLVGFAVMGGIFSEGIDLKGDRLTGVVVVGVGLPQVGPEREILRRYFDESGKNGFDYAYVYPGMNKVLQAGGRLIRTEEDRGVLVLVDDRFREPKYRALLPAEWQTE